MLNLLNKNSGIIETVAVVIAVIIFIFERIITSRSNFRNRLNLFEAVKKQLDWNMQWLTDIVGNDKDIEIYYDPTRANFKCSSEVIKYAIMQGHGNLKTARPLLEALVNAHDAILYYNQQVQEQHDCRFSSPEITGMATRLYLKDPEVLKKWMCDINNRPEEIRNWLEELRLRNWAINNGKNNRLKPALLFAYKLVYEEISKTLNRKMWWHFWKS